MKRGRRVLCLMLTVILALSTVLGSTTASAAKAAKVKVGSKIVSGSYKYQVLSLKGKKGTAALIGVKSKKVQKVEIPEAVKSGNYTFTVVEIGNSAFKNCKKLRSVETNKALQVIGKNAFSGCTKLETLAIESKNLKKVGANALKGAKKVTLLVPDGRENVYAKAFNGKGQKETLIPTTEKAEEPEEAVAEPEKVLEEQTEANIQVAAIVVPETEKATEKVTEKPTEKQEETTAPAEAETKTEETVETTETTEAETEETVETTEAETQPIVATEAPETEMETQPTEATEAETKAAETTEAETTEQQTEAETEPQTQAATEAETEPQTQAATEPETQAPIETETEHVHSTEWVRVQEGYCIFKQVCTECGEEVGNREYRHETEKFSEPATCKTSGKEGSKCTVCGDVSFHYTKPLGHEWAETRTTVDATCTTDGAVYTACLHDGCTARKDEIILPATGHDWSEPVIDENGLQTKHCQNENCGAIEQKRISAKVWDETKKTCQHEWNDGTVTMQPTCGTEGILKKTCVKCGEVERESIPATEQHNWTEKPKVEATCSKAGTEAYTYCKNCGKVQGEIKEIPATGKHEWVKNISLMSAMDDSGEKDTFCGCDLDQFTVYRCMDCGVYEITPGQGHNFEEGSECLFKKARDTWTGEYVGSKPGEVTLDVFIQFTAFLVDEDASWTDEMGIAAYRQFFDVTMNDKNYKCCLVARRSLKEEFSECAPIPSCNGKEFKGWQEVGPNGELGDMVNNSNYPFCDADGRVYVAKFGE